MVKPITHKHGSSFIAKITGSANGAALDLTPYTITSQIRARDSDRLMPGVTVTIVNAATGRFNVTALDTSGWNESDLLWDVVLTDAGGVIASSDTVPITVAKRVTR